MDPVRPTIDQAAFEAAVAEAPPPTGMAWALDPACSSDRVRLFSRGRGELGQVYPPEEGEYGQWSWATVWRPEIQGRAASLPAALRRLLLAVDALKRAESPIWETLAVPDAPPSTLGGVE